MGTQPHPLPPADNDQPTRRLMRIGTLGILAFWLVVMSVLYFAMQYAFCRLACECAIQGSLQYAEASYHGCAECNCRWR